MVLSRRPAPHLRPRRTALLALLAGLLTLAFVLLLTTRVFASTIGGDDAFVAADTAVTSFDSFSMDIASNGDIYAVLCVSPAIGDATLRVFRSQDGGTTWKLWGTLAAAGYDLLQPRLRVIEGSSNKVYVAYTAYDGSTTIAVRVSSSLMTGSSAAWTTAVALQRTGVRMFHPDIAGDSWDRAAYYVTVIAEGDSSVTTTSSIYYALSATYGGSWGLIQRAGVAAAVGDRHQRPRLCYGHDYNLHATWQLLKAGIADAGVVYQRIHSVSGNLLGSQIMLAPYSDGNNDLSPVVAAEHGGNGVVAAWMRTSGYGKFRSSADGGVTWPPGDTLRMVNLSSPELLALPGTEGLYCVYGYDTFTLLLASWSAPLAWTTLGDFENRPYSDGLGTTNALAYDPTHSDRAATAWTVIHSGLTPDSLMFDAEWRGDPGNPHLKPGFPRALNNPPVTPPVLAGLEGTPMQDIVFGDAAGYVQAIGHTGTPVPGWPVHPGTIPDPGSVIVADLDADGHNEVAVGLANGKVYVYRDDGSLQSGWPFDTGTGDPAYVSAANFYYLPGKQLVVLSGHTIWVLKSNAVTASGYFPYTVTPTSPAIFTASAALGDVNNDGITDVVAGIGPDLYAISGYMSFVYHTAYFLDGDAIAGQPSLADFDNDGYLEIAFPTALGRVGLSRWTMTMMSGWPVTEPSLKAQTSVALANILGTSEPELAWSSTFDSTICLYYKDGASAVTWPHHTGAGWWVYDSPIVDHLDGGPGSVVVGSRDGYGYAWQNLGAPTPGWPRALGGQCEKSPASGDLDHDGILDVVFVTLDRLVAYSTGAVLQRTDVKRQWPMAGYDAAHTACLGCFAPIPGGAPGGVPAAALALLSPRPSPSRGDVRVTYTLPAAGPARLAVYDVTGRRVRALLDGPQPAGSAEARWDGRDADGRECASGIYYLRLEIGGAGSAQSVTRKALRVR